MKTQVGDLLCSDCQTAWPNIKAVIAYYNPPNQVGSMHFVYHCFPLPYHHFAYAAAQGAAIVKSLAPTQVFNWIDAVYTNQAQARVIFVYIVIIITLYFKRYIDLTWSVRLLPIS
jgi:hypothetical protein